MDKRAANRERIRRLNEAKHERELEFGDDEAWEPTKPTNIMSDPDELEEYRLTTKEKSDRAKKLIAFCRRDQGEGRSR